MSRLIKQSWMILSNGLHFVCVV